VVGPAAVSAGALVTAGLVVVVVGVTGPEDCGGFFGAVVLVGVLLVGSVVSVTVLVELCSALVGASFELLGFTGSSSTRPVESTG